MINDLIQIRCIINTHLHPSVSLTAADAAAAAVVVVVVVDGVVVFLSRSAWIRASTGTRARRAVAVRFLRWAPLRAALRR